METRGDLNTKQNRVAGALIGTFVGDALGMPVEGWSHQRIREIHGVVDKMLDARLGAGTYTDDTQMMIALTRSMIESQGLNADHLADSFLEHYEPDRGYGSGTTQVFQRWQNGENVHEASEQIFDGGSFGNGGSMRIAPVGVVYGWDPVRLAEALPIACGITHAHPLGLGGSYLQARSVGLARKFNGAIDPIAWVEELQETLPKDFDKDGILSGKLETMKTMLKQKKQPIEFETVVRDLGCTSKAFESVPAAIYAFLANPGSFREAVVYAVGIGGDTDTIGAMTGAIAGARHGVRAVPDTWWSKLENGEDGRDAIVELAPQLTQRISV